jgi:hypothetical protein
MPPYESLTRVPFETGLLEAARKHHESADRDLSDFTRFETLEQALAFNDRQRERETAWRGTRPAPWLLEHDLIAFCGKKYGEIGPRLMKELQGRAP